MTSYVDCRQELAHLLPDETEMNSLRVKLDSDADPEGTFASSSTQQSILEDEAAPDRSLNTWSAQMATRMLGSVPRRMSFRRKLHESYPGSLDVQQPLLQQHSRISEVRRGLA